MLRTPDSDSWPQRLPPMPASDACLRRLPPTPASDSCLRLLPPMPASDACLRRLKLFIVQVFHFNAQNFFRNYSKSQKSKIQIELTATVFELDSSSFDMSCSTMLLSTKFRENPTQKKWKFSDFVKDQWDPSAYGGNIRHKNLVLFDVWRLATPKRLDLDMDLICLIYAPVEYLSENIKNILIRLKLAELLKFPFPFRFLRVSLSVFPI